MTKAEEIFNDDFYMLLRPFLNRASNFGQGLEDAECSSNFKEVQFEPHPFEIEIFPKEFTFSINVILNILKNHPGLRSMNEYYKIQLENINGSFYDNNFHFDFSNAKISNKRIC